MKWRRIDQNGYIKPDGNIAQHTAGQAEYRLTSELNTQFFPRVPEKMLEANTIAPPGQEFAHNLVKRYLAAAPINFKVHPAPPVIDFTAT